MSDQWLPISYRVVGQDDYVLSIDVDAAGGYRVDTGDHTSHKPRGGTLEPVRIQRLTQLADALGDARDHPAPAGATGFMVTLTLGEGTGARVFRFWEGALDADPPLRDLVRELELL